MSLYPNLPLKTAIAFLQEGRAGFEVVPNLSPADCAELSSGGQIEPSYALYIAPAPEYQAEWEDKVGCIEPEIVCHVDDMVDAGMTMISVMRDGTESKFLP